MKVKLAAMATGGTDRMMSVIEDFYVSTLTMEKGDKFVDIMNDKSFLRANKNASYVSPLMYILFAYLVYYLWT